MMNFSINLPAPRRRCEELAEALAKIANEAHELGLGVDGIPAEYRFRAIAAYLQGIAAKENDQ